MRGQKRVAALMTRASILFRKMDCRLKAGNDDLRSENDTCLISTTLPAVRA